MQDDKLTQDGFICSMSGEWEEMYCRRCAVKGCSKQKEISEVKRSIITNELKQKMEEN